MCKMHDANIVKCSNPEGLIGLAVKGVCTYSPAVYLFPRHTHTHRMQFLLPDNKCHIIVMYSRGPHHINVAVMESQFEAAGLDM